MAFSTIPTAGLSTGGANFRNLIINGDMSISQRGTSFDATQNYKIDRFLFAHNGYGFDATLSQSTDVPTGQGFGKSLKFNCTTASSVSSGGYLIIQQKIEGQMLQQIKKGTANAESLTFSFWVKSNKTGTYITEIYDYDNARQISKSYTIDSADTWEKKTVTFEGDTTGSLDNDNAESFQINFWLGAGTDFTSGTLSTTWTSATNTNRTVGQVNLTDSTSNYINITGVQLEVGTSASDFEFLPYDVNLQRCFRYYELLASGSGKTLGFGGTYNANTPAFASYLHPKRATPSIDQTSGTRYYRIYGNGVEYTWTAYSAFLQPTQTQVMFVGSGTISQGFIGLFDTINGSSYIAYDAEL